MKTNSRIILGIVGAAAAGAIIGLLVAPDKGSELRKKISNAASDFASELTNLLAKGKEEYANAKESIVNETKGLKSDAEVRYGKVKETLS